MSLQQWQAEGHDPNTTANSIPDDDTIIQWGRELLLLSNNARV
jgi:hypothetical protein